jgi:aspartate/methionine/tyrosine aminotransferase
MDSPIGANAHLLDRVPADRPLIDVSQGAPGFPTAPEIVARVAEVAADPDGGRYTPLFGLPELRSALATELGDAYGGDVGVDDVCITAGCNQAFCMVTSAIAEPGDDVVVPLPYYFNHDMWLGLDGVEARYVRPAEGLTPTAAEVAEKLTPRSRAVVLVTPGNPTGHVADPDRIGELADLARDRGLALILDETYRAFVPGAEAPHRLFERSDWRDYVVSLHSFSKDFAIPGHRVGAIVGHPDLLREAAKLIDCVTICAPRLGQEGAIAGLTRAREWRATKVAEIAANQRRFEAVMAARPGGFELLSAGGYYGWVRHPFPDVESGELVRRLLVEQGVLTIPGTAFMPADEQMLRFSFANATGEELDALGGRLEEFARSVAGSG